ncbi:Ferric siderophore transport system, biopolymer transport protein ExbB [hydrothermal vent metagenome]|uniref:Ferric siderophore transport system, biopolymer transport protein ExbB n=1 Tax=hydrothermal vent metagenome TaxID=652676 RepID=A0A1W1D4T3_9ZZZZ
MNVELIKDITDYGIIGILGLMSFLSVWFYIERLLFYRKVDVKTYKHKQQLEIDLTKHISIISSFGSNAPYIGLLGTVVSIIITFYIMGQNGQMEVKTIMSSLALALKATAMGLVVAIPSMLFYNHIARKIEVFLALWEMEHNED